MALRANYFGLAAKGMQILMTQESYLQQQFSTSVRLSLPLWELVKLRVSQINQCAFCVDMHSKATLQQGESQERVIGLSAWRDMPFYSDTEMMALDWAEHLTQGLPVNDDKYAQVVEAFGEQGLVDLTIAVNAINSWNRIAKTFKPEVGSFKPAAHD
ncbi:carboxymuconolactone decarboxylase family protein [Shewanella sp. FJAT-52076]|uniref:carboxymuconolactone decarboxylase family protein n=1 Tax=Shewanella sp. FJAT-52076 TaxID=2864202 RepID=UPI001C65D392|nr:carboxymuconolactone decarboxylase family protein [Shewanella sp. FJAT-52076]QYJ76683.1 carboxymuconolactone decarboxylase family protein [Shewanella sp. FJAT-52076]